MNILICAVPGVSYFHFAILTYARQITRKETFLILLRVLDRGTGVLVRKKELQLFNSLRRKLRNISGNSFYFAQKKQKSSNDSKRAGGIYLCGL